MPKQEVTGPIEDRYLYSYMKRRGYKNTTISPGSAGISTLPDTYHYDQGHQDVWLSPNMRRGTDVRLLYSYPSQSLCRYVKEFQENLHVGGEKSSRRSAAGRFCRARRSGPALEISVVLSKLARIAFWCVACTQTLSNIAGRSCATRRRTAVFQSGE